MSKSTNYFGIDTSKDVFDVVDFKLKHHQFLLIKKGLKNY